MVTTNCSGFEGMLVDLDGLHRQIESKEEEQKFEICNLISRAIDSLQPVVKYIEQEHSSAKLDDRTMNFGETIRGIFIGVIYHSGTCASNSPKRQLPVFLTRSGLAVCDVVSNYLHLINVDQSNLGAWFFGSGEEEVDKALDNIQTAIRGAMTKMKQRLENLEKRDEVIHLIRDLLKS